MNGKDYYLFDVCL